MTKNDLIAVLGYGSQGKAIALNLRDSGHGVIVGLRHGSASRRKAGRDQIAAMNLRDAARRADIIVIAIPDHCHKAVLTARFFAALQKSPALVFLHGSSIHFGLVIPPRQLSVLLLAPHAPGKAVRQNFLAHNPYSAFYAVHQGSPKTGGLLLKRLAEGIGIPHSRLVKTTFADEAIGDLFGEQAVLCGGLARLVKLGFETLVEAGLPPENAYLEVAYQLDLIIALIKQHGLTGMFDRVSALARYGAAVNGPRIVTARVKQAMVKILADIESGRFISQADRAGARIDRKQMAELTNRLFDKAAAKFSDHD